MPDAFPDVMSHADQFFRVELDAPRFVHGAGLIQDWLPRSVPYELPGTGHLLMAQNPTAMAARLEQFWTDS